MDQLEALGFALNQLTEVIATVDDLQDEDEIIMDTLGTPAYSLFTPGV